MSDLFEAARPSVTRKVAGLVEDNFPHEKGFWRLIACLEFCQLGFPELTRDELRRAVSIAGFRVNYAGFIERELVCDEFE